MMQGRWWLAALGLLGASDPSAQAQAARRAVPPGLLRVPRQALHVTEGSLEVEGGGPLRAEAPKVRAVLQRVPSEQDVALDFTFLGPTAEQIPLGSGELRQQVALKLRAADGCNLLYATWRFTPRNAVVVSIKANPGQRTSAECGNRGYRNLAPRRVQRPPAIAPGAHHVFRASVTGNEMTVWIDGDEVWTGEVPEEAKRLHGPVGIRTDNVRIAFTLMAPSG